MRFIFTFSNFHQLDIHNKTYVALADLQWNMTKIRIENQTSPGLVMIIESAGLLISYMNTKVLPIGLTIECGVEHKIDKRLEKKVT